jgi:hypothetical protein
MKRNEKKSPLSLTRETLRTLGETDLDGVGGGGTSTQQCISGLGMCRTGDLGHSRLEPTRLCAQ